MSREQAHLAVFAGVIVVALACAGAALWLFTIPERHADAEKLAVIVVAAILWLAFVAEDWK